jgi:hypothetical protein
MPFQKFFGRCHWVNTLWEQHEFVEFPRFSTNDKGGVAAVQLTDCFWPISACHDGPVIEPNWIGFLSSHLIYCAGLV